MSAASQYLAAWVITQIFAHPLSPLAPDQTVLMGVDRSLGEGKEAVNEHLFVTFFQEC